MPLYAGAKYIFRSLVAPPLLVSSGLNIYFSALLSKYGLGICYLSQNRIPVLMKKADVDCLYVDNEDVRSCENKGYLFCNVPAVYFSYIIITA